MSVKATPARTGGPVWTETTRSTALARVATTDRIALVSHLTILRYKWTLFNIVQA